VPHIIASVLPGIAPEWEKDGLRLLESSLSPKEIQLTLSATPQVDPITLASRVKGRIQYHCRCQGGPIDFSRKVSVRSIGDPTRTAVESYVRNQVPNEDLADDRFRELLKSFTVVNPEVNLSVPSETNSGRYWYNLHLVFVTSGRYRLGEARSFALVRDTVLRICQKKGHAVSTMAVLPDHLHLAIRGAIEHSPEVIALAFLNNLAHVLGQRLWWQAGYYAGTFGEYGMGAIREYGTQAVNG
jgi:REP element-mobilizing transposase RayT